MAAEKNTVFIFGLGYVGVHLARQLFAAGWQIIGTTRTPEKFAAEIEQGWTILPFSSDHPNADIPGHFHKASHIISTIGPVDGRDPVLAAYAREIASFSGWTGYLSATSVYPDQPQGWVDETTAPDPATERGKARLLAEQYWQETTDTEIFRIAGIYGPGRNAIEALQQGRARIIEKQGQLSNRIHQSDITKIICAAMDRPRPERIVNLCDEEPAPQGEVVRYAAQLLGIEPPEPIPFEQAELTPMARSFYVSRRRLRSKIIGPELGIELDYPTYREGLRALLEGQEKA